jgi:hypothetical protein
MNRELVLHQALVYHEDAGWIFSNTSDGGVEIMPPQKLCDEYGLNENASWNVKSVEDALAFIRGFEEARFLERTNTNLLLRKVTDPAFVEDALDDVHEMDVTIKTYAKAVVRAIREEMLKSGRRDG